MKKSIVLLSIILLFTLSLTGCGSKKAPTDDSLIEDVATKYVTALQSYDYAKFDTLKGLEFVTKHWGTLLQNNFEVMRKSVTTIQEVQKVESVQVDSISLTSATAATANLKYTASGTRAGKEYKETFQGPIKLFKIDGAWYIEADETKKAG